MADIDWSYVLEALAWLAVCAVVSWMAGLLV